MARCEKPEGKFRRPDRLVVAMAPIVAYRDFQNSGRLHLPPGFEPQVRNRLDFDTDGRILHIDAPIRTGILRVVSDGRNRRRYMAKKQSSDKTATLASKVLSGAKKPTIKEAKKLAASVLSQDEKKGKRGR